MANNKSNLGNISQILNDKTESFINVPNIVLPTSGTTAGRTFIQNRAPLPDPENDLGVRFGTERVYLRKIEPVQDEIGPSTNPGLVWKDPNDPYDRVRFCGNWKEIAGQEVATSLLGVRIESSSNNTDFLEITFYGTGLNLLTMWDVPGYSATYQVDGAAASGNFFFSGLPDLHGVNSTRGWPSMTCVEVVKGLTPGLHTVRINQNGGALHLLVLGYDILNETTTIRAEKGEAFHKGKKIFHPLAENLALTSDFESGVLLTKGGAVSVYLKPDGTVKKSLNPVIENSKSAASISSGGNTFDVDSPPIPGTWSIGTVLELSDSDTNRELVRVTGISGTQITTLNNITNNYNTATVTLYGQAITDQVNRSNEQLIRSYNWREFGNAVGLDFQTLRNADSTVAMSLSDNATNLVGAGVQRNTSTLIQPDAYNISSNGDTYFTFVGTGLDIELTNVSGGIDQHAVYLDGQYVGNISDLANDQVNRLPICSDLPYGTHTIMIDRIGGTGTVFYHKFYVYGPKLPTISEDYLPLSYYFINANHKIVTEKYSNSGQARFNIASVSWGTIRKHSQREWQYRTGPNTGMTGADWDVAVPSTAVGAHIGGWMFRSGRGDAAGNPIVQIPFFGTGFDFRHQTDAGNASNLELYLIDTDGTRKRIDSTNFGTATFDVSSNVLFNSGTWNLDVSSATVTTGVLSVKNLPLGQYTFGINNLTAGGGEELKIEAFDVITPVHATATAKYHVVNNDLNIGNNSLIDLRNTNFIGKSDIPQLWEAFGINDNHVVNLGTNFDPSDLCIPLYLEEDSLVQFDFSGTYSANNTNLDISAKLYIDNRPVMNEIAAFPNGADEETNISFSKTIRLSAGYHFAQMFITSLNGAIVTERGTARMLTAKVIK